MTTEHTHEVNNAIYDHFDALRAALADRDAEPRQHELDDCIAAVEAYSREVEDDRG